MCTRECVVYMSESRKVREKKCFNNNATVTVSAVTAAAVTTVLNRPAPVKIEEQKEKIEKQFQ